MLGGTSNSDPSPFKTSLNYGTYDYWLVRIDRDGNRIWDRSFGGDDWQMLWGLAALPDGGVLAVGTSESPPSGNKTTPHYGDDDWWVVNLAPDGTLRWQATYGGASDEDSNLMLRVLPDGGFILAGASKSGPSGNRTAPAYGGKDVWMVRADAAGNVIWDRSFGGREDEGGCTAVPLPDGGMVLSMGSASPPSGNKTTPNFGGFDAWVLRLDSQGEILWQRSLGGEANDWLGVHGAGNNTLWLIGRSYSGTGGNKTTPNEGETDGWVVAMDLAGQVLGQASYGGTGYEELYKAALLPDGGVVVAGSSGSPPSHTLTSPYYGNDDYLLVRFGPMEPGLRQVMYLDPGVSPPAPGLLLYPGAAAGRCVTESSADLVSWTPWRTNLVPLTGWATTNLPGNGSQFFRTRAVP